MKTCHTMKNNLISTAQQMIEIWTGSNWGIPQSVIKECVSFMEKKLTSWQTQTTKYENMIVFLLSNDTEVW